MDGTFGLMARLMYGTGMRLMECVRLRVLDVDFDNGLILVRNGKGGKDRAVPLPQRLREPLQVHLTRVEAQHRDDLAAGGGAVYLPPALARKYPSAQRDWIWQYVFPSARLSQDPDSGQVRRHHLHESSLQRAVKAAEQAARIAKRVNSHALRHNPGWRIMPSRPAIAVWRLGSRAPRRGIIQRLFRKASKASSGRYRPWASLSGVVRSSASCLISRLAWR